MLNLNCLKHVLDESLRSQTVIPHRILNSNGELGFAFIL